MALTLPLTLNARDAYANALKAARNNELQFQTNPGATCRFSRGCAIAASWTPEVREAISEYGLSIGTLVQEGAVTSDDAHALVRLQMRHDTMSGSISDKELTTEEATAEFVKFCEDWLAAQS